MSASKVYWADLFTHSRTSRTAKLEKVLERGEEAREHRLVVRKERRDHIRTRLVKEGCRRNWVLCVCAYFT